MNLKPQSIKATLPSLAAPSWGELADEGQPVSVVVFECSEAIYSYPYHTLSRWVLAPGASDTLRIKAGGDEVTIEGRNLRVVGDALCSARLRLLRVANDRYDVAKEAVVISRIRFENK